MTTWLLIIVMWTSGGDHQIKYQTYQTQQECIDKKISLEYDLIGIPGNIGIYCARGYSS